MIVVDTHVWLWMVAAPDRLSSRARGAIDAAGEVRVSAMSCWEIGMLESTGRVTLDRDLEEWIRRSLMALGIDTLDVDPGVAVRAAHLYAAGVRADPADLLIAGTALEYRAPLVSRDRAMASVPELNVVW